MQISNKSIRTVLKEIDSKNLILPALQREFVWKRKQIENLFDSLLQGFPINTLMIWNVDDIKKEFMEFYEFLKPDFKENVSKNDVYIVRDNDKKSIVIDGQQRLTSLWIAVYGSYESEKGKNKMFLYLNLDEHLKNDDSEDSSIDSTESYYNFKFMAKDKADKLIAAGQHWILVREAYANDFIPSTYIVKNGLSESQFANKTVQALYDLFRNETVLNAYEITDSSMERVLNVFVRTNSGGKPLTKGDLLLSVITVNWAKNNKINARDYVQMIANKADTYGYKVDKDWVLSCILYVLNKDIKLSVDNFDKKTSEEIYKNRDRIKDSIEATFRLLNCYGMLERGLTTKLALLPIVYHIYNHKIVSQVASYKKGQKLSPESGINLQMRTWLFRAIVLGFFTSGTNEKLRKIQKIQKEKISSCLFPVDDIISSDTGLGINKEKIDEIMNTEKKNAFPILNIIYSSTQGISYIDASREYDVDHIHAQAQFDKSSGDYRYNMIANLQLLDFQENRSKNDTSLKDWWSGKSDDEKRSYLLQKDFDTDLSAFDDFYEQRKEWLTEILKEKLGAKDLQKKQGS